MVLQFPLGYSRGSLAGLIGSQLTDFKQASGHHFGTHDVHWAADTDRLCRDHGVISLPEWLCFLLRFFVRRDLGSRPDCCALPAIGAAERVELGVG